MKNIIKIFNKIRDLPYHCPEFLKDTDYRCWGKNRLLFKALNEAGIETRYRVCDFIWQEQRVPPEIAKLAPVGIDKHLFLEARINDKWVVLDSSNDSKFPSYNKWDGKSNCELAVRSSRIYSPEESINLERKEMETFAEDFEKYKDFYVSLNKFFDKIKGLKRK